MTTRFGFCPVSMVRRQRCGFWWKARMGAASGNTVGVSINIIEASWQALIDSVNYKLMKEMSGETLL